MHDVLWPHCIVARARASLSSWPFLVVGSSAVLSITIPCQNILIASSKWICVQIYTSLVSLSLVTFDKIFYNWFGVRRTAASAAAQRLR